jgi:hypothetical protein
MGLNSHRGGAYDAWTNRTFLVLALVKNLKLDMSGLEGYPAKIYEFIKACAADSGYAAMPVKPHDVVLTPDIYSSRVQVQLEDLLIQQSQSLAEARQRPLKFARSLYDKDTGGSRGVVLYRVA